MSKFTEQKCFEIGLTDLCLILHGSLSGSGSSLTKEEENDIKHYLSKRLSEWKNHHDKYSYFDRAIKQLIEISLIEFTLHQSNIDMRNMSLDQIITMSFYM